MTEYLGKRAQRDALEDRLKKIHLTDGTQDSKLKPELALRIYDILTDIAYHSKINKNNKVGTMIILGFEETYRRYAGAMDENHFEEKDLHICENSTIDEIIASTEYDGAILVDKNGKIIESGVKLMTDDFEVLNEMSVPYARTLSERFGFCEKVGTRHTSGISASYRMSDVLIFCMSEESGQIRTFYRGQIISSPHRSEVDSVRTTE